MFKKGQAVVCVDEKMEGIGSVLEKNKVYHIEEFNSVEECKKLWPDSDWWPKNGGRVTLKETGQLEWFANRFEPVE